MRNVFLTSDTHFCHANIMGFTDYEGKPTRPIWHERYRAAKVAEDGPAIDALVDEMNDYIVARWNSVVRPGDRVYHLGDVFMGTAEKFRSAWARLNGQKRLILGNHDNVDQLRGCFKK